MAGAILGQHRSVVPAGTRKRQRGRHYRGLGATTAAPVPIHRTWPALTSAVPSRPWNVIRAMRIEERHAAAAPTQYNPRVRRDPVRGKYNPRVRRQALGQFGPGAGPGNDNGFEYPPPGEAPPPGAAPPPSGGVFDVGIAPSPGDVPAPAGQREFPWLQVEPILKGPYDQLLAAARSMAVLINVAPATDFWLGVGASPEFPIGKVQHPADQFQKWLENARKVSPVTSVTGMRGELEDWLKSSLVDVPTSTFNISSYNTFAAGWGAIQQLFVGWRAEWDTALSALPATIGIDAVNRDIMVSRWTSTMSAAIGEIINAAKATWIIDLFRVTFQWMIFCESSFQRQTAQLLEEQVVLGPYTRDDGTTFERRMTVGSPEAIALINRYRDEMRAARITAQQSQLLEDARTAIMLCQKYIEEIGLQMPAWISDFDAKKAAILAQGSVVLAGWEAYKTHYLEEESNWAGIYHFAQNPGLYSPPEWLDNGNAWAIYGQRLSEIDQFAKAEPLRYFTYREDMTLFRYPTVHPNSAIQPTTEMYAYMKELDALAEAAHSQVPALTPPPGAPAPPPALPGPPAPPFAPGLPAGATFWDIPPGWDRRRTHMEKVLNWGALALIVILISRYGIGTVRTVGAARREWKRDNR